jgi:hypothetical protein
VATCYILLYCTSWDARNGQAPKCYIIIKLLCSPQKLCEFSCKGVARKCFNLSSSPLQSRVYRSFSPACFGVSTYLTCDSWASLEFGIPQFAYQSTFLIWTLTFYVIPFWTIYRPYTKTKTCIAPKIRKIIKTDLNSQTLLHIKTKLFFIVE